MSTIYWNRSRRLMRGLFKPGQIVTWGNGNQISEDDPPVSFPPIPSQTFYHNVLNSVDFSSYFQGVVDTYAISATPTGMTLDVNTGILSGTPTVDDQVISNATVTATNTNGSAVSNQFNMTIVDVPPAFVGNITDIGLIETIPMTPVDTAPEFTGEDLTYNFEQPAPTGISIGSLNGIISGTAGVGTAGNYPQQVKVTNTGGFALSNLFNIGVILSANLAIDELGNFLVDELGNNLTDLS